MGYLYRQDQILVDQSMYELQKHGTKEFPFQVYLNDFSRFRGHLEDWHCHLEMEFTVALKGEFECGMNERRCRIRPGEGVFVNSGVLHMHRALGRYEDSESISIVFLPQFVSGGTDNLIFRKFVEPVMQDTGLRGEPLRRDVRWQEDALDCLLDIYRLSRKDSWIAEMKIRDRMCEAWELLVENRREEGARKETAPADMVYEERAKQILRYIQSHYQEDISIEDMAHQVHISRTECFRCFQRITGKSPKNYLNSYRIRQAMRRLETTQDSVTDICFSCGFNHMSYFVKRFRESVGMSPGKYRDMMRGREDLPATEAEKGEQHA